MRRGQQVRGALSSSRVKAYRKGCRAEIWAEIYYRARGYRVIARRYKCPQGEIDLILRRGRALVFTEVKARAHVGGALESVRKQSQERIEKAARIFLSDHPRYNDFSMRFDVAAVVLLWNVLPIRFECVDNAWMVGA